MICDDGGNESGDGCSATCQAEFCGNGVHDPGELCDDGNQVGGDGCSADCLSDEACPNGTLDLAAGERAVETRFVDRGAFAGAPELDSMFIL